jgi:hypothetical protein
MSSSARAVQCKARLRVLAAHARTRHQPASTILPSAALGGSCRAVCSLCQTRSRSSFNRWTYSFGRVCAREMSRRRSTGGGCYTCHPRFVRSDPVHDVTSRTATCCRQRACSVARDTGRPSRADRGACRSMARLQFPVIPGREQNERTRNPETGTEFVPDFGSGATCRPGMTARLHRRLHPGSGSLAWPNAADSRSEAARTRRALLPRLCRAVAAGVGHCSKRRAAMIGIESAASRRASARHHEFPSNLHLAAIFGQIAYSLE